MRYAILGSGAMGLRYGILLQQAGFTVDFIDTWKPEIEKIRKQNGVYVSRNGKNKKLVQINIYYPEEYKENPDIIFPFTKQMQLEDMLKRCSHFFNDHQFVVTCMNGMGHIDKINKYFRPEKVTGGTAMIGTVLNAPGDVDFIGEQGCGDTYLANELGKDNEGTNQIINDFEKAGLTPHLTYNFLGTLITKVIYNSIVNSLCTMDKLKEGEFASKSISPKLIHRLLDEDYEICKSAHIKPLNNKKEEYDSIVKNTRDITPLHYPSMYQDLSNGRPTEVDYINGYMYRLGKKHGYEAVAHDFLRDLVHLSEQVEGVKNK